ncbi:MAG TPA: hypothetical protein VIG64_05205 [Actinomycetota bacterium]|jgi:ABC-type Fe3+ transport system permease subunit
MLLLIGIVCGVLLLVYARSERRRGWYAPTEIESAAHLRHARVLKVVGWVLIVLCVAIPLAFVVLWTLFPPTFTF